MALGIWFLCTLIMKKYNVGIIGYGWAATAHIEAINKTKQAQVTAI
jgi:predicted dehydrogenase